MHQSVDCHKTKLPLDLDTQGNPRVTITQTTHSTGSPGTGGSSSLTATAAPTKGGGEPSGKNSHCMDRPKRAATKVTDFRRFHLSGDLEQEVHSILDSRINQFKMATTAEELQQQLEAEREQSKKLQQDAELMKIQNELEVEKLKQQQWQSALDRLKEAREQVHQEHDKCMEQMKEIAASASTTNNSTVQWLKAQVESLASSSNPEQTLRLQKEQEEKERAIAEVKQQQEELSKKLMELEGTTPSTNPTAHNPWDMINKTLNPEGPTANPQEDLMQ